MERKLTEKKMGIVEEKKEENEGGRKRGEGRGGRGDRSLSGHAAWLSIWFGWSFKRNCNDELIASDRLLLSASSTNQLQHLGLAHKKCCSAPMTLPEWKARAEPTLPSPVPENKSYGLIYKTKLSHWPFSNQLYVVNTFVSPILCKNKHEKASII